MWLVGDHDLRHQFPYLIVFLTWCPTQASSSHVRAADRFDLLHTTELWFGQQL